MITDPTSVLFIDLDRFKGVNDSLGHEAGDQLLAAVAARIRGCVRASDTTARLGGDEFAVLLHDSTIDAAVAVAERIINVVREPFRVSGRDVFIGASVGVAISRDAGDKPDVLLNNADVAMYRAKKDGPGKVVLYEPYMHAEALNYLSLRGDLQRALNEAADPEPAVAARGRLRSFCLSPKAVIDLRSRVLSVRFNVLYASVESFHPRED